MKPEHRAQLSKLAPDHLRLLESAKGSTERAGRVSARRARQAAAAVDEEFSIDLSNPQERLTVGDLEDIEDATGIPAFRFFSQMGKSLKGTAALIWVLRRKEDPDFTYEQARNLPMGKVLGAFAEVGRQAKADSGPLDKTASKSA